jgi:PAS domain S-box-containing protein
MPEANVAMGLNVKSRRPAARAPCQNERSYHEFVDSLPQTVFEMDLAGNFTYANRWALETFGYSQGDFERGLHLMDMFPRKERVRIWSEIDEVLRGIRNGKERRKEYILRRKDGTTFPGIIHASPIFNVGHPVGFRGIVVDISERKAAEECLRALSARLQTAREEERTTIAREIHDELGQQLTGLKMDLAWLGGKLPKEAKLLIKKVEDMSGLIDATIQSVRRISSELRPGVLDHLGLSAAIEWQVREFQLRTGIRCEFAAPRGDLRVERRISTAIFRIFQEALTNVARHARATRVKVSLKQEGGVLGLKVQDNGRGITERERKDRRSLGLMGMRERALFFGGKFDVKGVPGKGTLAFLRMPVSGKETDSSHSA